MIPPWLTFPVAFRYPDRIGNKMSQLAPSTRLRVNVVDFPAEVRLSIECTCLTCAPDDKSGGRTVPNHGSRCGHDTHLPILAVGIRACKALLAADETPINAVGKSFLSVFTGGH